MRQAPGVTPSVADPGPPADVVDRLDQVTELYATHRLQLVRLALVLVADQASAEDAVQDVFVRLARRTDLDPTTLTSAYLRTAVVNQSRTALRKRVVRRKFAHLESGPEVDAAPAADEPSLLAAQRSLVLGQIRLLPRRQREVVVLRYYENLNRAETAAVLGMSPSAVSSAESIALKKLTEMLGGRHV